MNRMKTESGCAVLILVFARWPTTTLCEAADISQEAPIAQHASASVASPAACRCIGQEGSSAVERINAVLNVRLKDTGLDYNKAPLEQVVNGLQDEYGISIQLDLPALKDAGLNPQEPTTVNLRNITLRSALRLMLREHQLTYIISNEALIITTPEAAEVNPSISIYDVRDLIGGQSEAEGIKMLTHAIKSTVAPETWATNGGGQFEICPLNPGLLVISQTQAVQEQIRDLLETVRRVRQQPPASSESAGRQ